MHHEFVHAAVRGAGYAAGREAFHAIGLVGVLAILVVVALVALLGKRT
jgi:uncharacterized membrane protein YkvI